MKSDGPYLVARDSNRLALVALGLVALSLVGWVVLIVSKAASCEVDLTALYEGFKQLAPDL